MWLRVMRCVGVEHKSPGTSWEGGRCWNGGVLVKYARASIMHLVFRPINGCADAAILSKRNCYHVATDLHRNDDRYYGSSLCAVI